MADYDPYGGGDYTRPRAARPRTSYTPTPAVTTSQTPAPATPEPSAPQGPQDAGWYTPPPNAGSWNSYYQQPGTTQPVTPPTAYQMGADFRYNLPTASAPSLGAYTNRMEGFDTGNLNDPAMTTAKYAFARVASKYDPTQQGYAQLMQDPEFQRLGMQSIGNGDIRLPNGDVIDVVRAFQNGNGAAWQWGAKTVNGKPTDWDAPAAPAASAANPWAQVQQSYLQQQQAWQQQQAQQWAQQQAWQAQQQAMQQQAWQAYLAQLQQPPMAPAYPPDAQGADYTQFLPASPDYGGDGGYNAGVGLQGGGGSPYADAFSYLSQGMPSPYMYG